MKDDNKEYHDFEYADWTDDVLKDEDENEDKKSVIMLLIMISFFFRRKNFDRDYDDMNNGDD